MKRLSLLIAVVLLGGCTSMSGGSPRETAHEFYSLDTRDFRLCRGTSKDCVKLTYIASMQEQLGPMEELYGANLQGPNYPLSLTRIMISPPNQAYTTQRLDEEGRYRRLPINQQTNWVWTLLKKETTEMYH